jgi:hypothetical protein
MSKYGRFNFGSANSDGNAWTETVGEQGPLDDEVCRLRRELTALKVALADRETALARTALDAQQVRDRWQRELSNAENAWKAEEAVRLAAAEAQWREQFESALAEVTARCEAAELMLARSAREAADEPNEALDRDYLGERANRATELQQIISAPAVEGEGRTEESNIVIRNNRVWAAQAIEQRRRASRENATRSIVAAALLGVFAVAAYAGIEALLQSWPSLRLGQ